jgi:hypothetical protein
MLEQFLLIPTAKDVYLLPSLIINPHLDHCPNAGEEEGGVDDEHAAQHLRVVVLRHLGSRLHELVSGTSLGELDVLQVQDAACVGNASINARLLEALLRASVEDGGEKRLVKHVVVSQEAIRSSHLPDLFRCGKAEPLDIDGRVLGEGGVTLRVYL